MTSDQSEWLSPKAASAFTGLGISSLAKLRMTGDGPPFSRPLPNAVRYSRANLAAWMASKGVAQAAE